MSKGQTENYRFTLRFNPADEKQKKAYEALQDKGRHKSAFIAEAVVFYLKNHGMNPEISSVDKNSLRQIVLEIMSEEGLKTLVAVADKNNTETEKNPENKTSANTENVQNITTEIKTEKIQAPEETKSTTNSVIEEAIDSADLDDLLNNLDAWN